MVRRQILILTVLLLYSSLAGTVVAQTSAKDNSAVASSVAWSRSVAAPGAGPAGSAVVIATSPPASAGLLVEDQPATPVPEPPKQAGPKETSGVVARRGGQFSQSSSGSTLLLKVEGPAEVAPGQMASFTVVARNAGTEALAGVGVELPLPDAIRLIGTEPIAERKGNRLSWNLGNLYGGAERRLKVDLDLGQSSELNLSPTGTFSVVTGLRSKVVRPMFDLAVLGPDSAVLGGKIIWRIRLANKGPTPTPHMSLTCRFSEGLAHEQGDHIQTDLPGGILPGKDYTINLPVAATRPGPQVISLSARADDGRTVQAQAIVKIDELALALAIHGPSLGRVGESLSYRIEVSNPYPGSNRSGPIRLTQALPQGLEFIGASSGGVYNSVTHAVSWTLPGLPDQQRIETSFQVRAQQSGAWSLNGSAEAEGAVGARTEYASNIVTPPALSVDIAIPDGPLAVDGQTTYEVRIRNRGSQPVAGVRLGIVLPEILRATHASAPTGSRIQGSHVLFEPIGQMGAHVAAVYRIQVQGVSKGSSRFHVEVTADGLGKAIEQERSCQVQSNTIGE
jgi:hypothetical protein